MPLFNLKKSRRRRSVPWLERRIRRWFYDIYVKDLQLNLELEAMRESVAYIREHMPDALIFTDWHELHAHALDQAGIDGLFLEFGTKRGHSLREIAAMTPHTVHGFDSFQGLPEDWGGTSLRRGKFRFSGNLVKLPANTAIHKGWFEDTLPGFVDEHRYPVAYMHLDCDLYSSTKTVFRHLAGRIVPGSVIVFDEYFNYPNWRRHEFRAFQEFVSEHGLSYRYLGFLSHAGVVSVRITGKG